MRSPFPFSATELVHAVGDSLRARVEEHENPDRVDHVWITMNVGRPERLLISVNTISARNRDAGFDKRIRVGMMRAPCALLPALTLERCSHFDYAEIEASTNVYYEHYECVNLENLLLDLTARAARLEVWGEFYYNKGHLGIHQIHSRRAGCVVTEDIHGRDGALRFYIPDTCESVLLFFKFCGQP